MALAEQLMHDY